MKSCKGEDRPPVNGSRWCKRANGLFSNAMGFRGGGWVGVMSKPCINFAIKLLDPELLDLKP